MIPLYIPRSQFSTSIKNRRVGKRMPYGNLLTSRRHPQIIKHSKPASHPWMIGWARIKRAIWRLERRSLLRKRTKGNWLKLKPIEKIKRVKMNFRGIPLSTVGFNARMHCFNRTKRPSIYRY